MGIGRQGTRGLSRREFLRLGGVGLAGVSLLGATGCGGDTSSSGETELAVWCREYAAAPLRAAVKMFNALDNGIKVDVTAIPEQQFPDQLSTALASDEAPDLVSINATLPPYFSSIGAFTDLTERYDSLAFKEQFNPVVARLGEDRQGVQYALPFSADVSALVYNRGLFEEAGLDPDQPPVTWHELREAAQRLTTGDRYGYVFAGGEPGGHMFTFMPYVWANGGEYLSEDGRRALLDSPEAIEALQFFTDLTLGDKVTPPGVVNYNGAENSEAFTAEKAAMIVTGNFDVENLNTNFPDLDYGVTLIPKPTDGSHSAYSGGDLVAITSQTDYVEEAWEFIKFGLSEEVQVEAFAKNGILPVRKDLNDNRYFEEEPKYKVFADAYTIGQMPYSPKYFELYNPLLSGMQSALQGKKTPEEAFTEATAEMNRIIQR